MKLKWIFLTLVFTMATVLTGCEPILALNPQGPQAETQTNVIWISIITMSIVLIVVMAILITVLIKYRSSKQRDDYEPPHIEGNPIVESIIVGFPIIIIIFLSIITVKTTYEVEATPEKYNDQEPLVIYASSSNWKWHFSYPEEDIETLNYVFIPEDRPVEFKLYSFGPITSFWIPQLGGQKYAMADMVTTLHLAADNPGEYWGRNANFSGEGFADHQFDVTVLTQKDFDQWVEDIHQNEEPITEDTFNKLLEPGHLGKRAFTGTHLEFSPAPEGEHAGHHHGDSDSKHDEYTGHHHDDNQSEHEDEHAGQAVR
ncbi:cytochrome aa3 quinol oxidase subunit II [Oceanobacillus caeni]|uniref:Quinol oxidase subunit 2 n=1 Tax=Oceanobacillus caeni TaxID=405946 RepID=A0ABR5MJP3_9BACI|nr:MULTISPECIES: cytochrome aa3 quinol oxidase subunit II [Bacillaceae]KKE78979.1 quinol oxidase subunit 2 [Bacilli bacterium VT-13-104]PZD83628.1 cytochrome aa3 quinol oxidase subunit II [Bacilli bacterium]KPH75828.1 quinol oxidase subunit 2 [Oceanobacillus caeni]MCR1835042.1 cytochrome aa3 quinol oxidase subunit II [Oceanobacillus caeni]MED4473725.1 cytochrome aa3 quinol oxidase subunit II [Oceanobacillus caeni]